MTKKKSGLVVALAIGFAFGFGIGFGIEHLRYEDERYLNENLRELVKSLETDLPASGDLKNRSDYVEKMIIKTAKEVDEINAAEYSKNNRFLIYDSKKVEFYNDCRTYLHTRLDFNIADRKEFDDKLTTLLNQWRDLRIDPHITK
jgi:hypothetical protein